MRVCVFSLLPRNYAFMLRVHLRVIQSSCTAEPALCSPFFRANKFEKQQTTRIFMLLLIVMDLPPILCGLPLTLPSKIIKMQLN